MNGRIYDGALGRFVQADPIIQDPLRVQSLNRYSYVWNNPLNATDPTGFMMINTTYMADDGIDMPNEFLANQSNYNQHKNNKVLQDKQSKDGVSLNSFSSDGESKGTISHQKEWDAYVKSVINSDPKKESSAAEETDSDTSPQKTTSTTDDYSELMGKDYRNYAAELHKKGQEVSTTGVEVLGILNPATPISKAKGAAKVAEKTVDALRKEEKIADSLNVASDVVSNSGTRFLVDKAGRRLDMDFFKGLKDSGQILKVSRSGEGRPLTAHPNTFARTEGGHVIVFGADGRRVMDISSQRIKFTEWHQGKDGQLFPKEGNTTKFDGPVPQKILNQFGL